MADNKENGEDWEYESEDGEDYEWEYETEEEGENKPGDKKADSKDDEDEEEEDEEEELELEDIDLPDPFSTEPTPSVKVSDVNGVNGTNSKEEEKKKHRKHRKSKHHDKFEKFRRLEKDEGRGGEESKGKKIHVRSKDPKKIARQFEKGDKEKERRQRKGHGPGKDLPKPKPIEINKICKVCGKEPYVVERIVAEKSWWCKNCFRCKSCNKSLNLDTYASHQGVIYCKPHHKELFQPKPVIMDLTEEIIKKNIDFSMDDPIERHRNQERKMETIVRENKPKKLEGVVKSKVDDSKWEGLDSLDVGSKFLMFEKGGDRERSSGSDRYGIMEKLKRLQAGEDVEDLLAEIDEEMPSMSEEEEEDEDVAGLTEVQKKAHNAEKLFSEESKKEKLMMQRKKEIKSLRDRLMVGTRENILDSFDELNHRKIKKTQVDVRSENAKKFMDMFNKGEIPENISASDRLTLEKDAELEFMRSKKREERKFFEKLENGEMETKEEPKPKLLIGKLKETRANDGTEGDIDTAPLHKKFSFFENYDEANNNEKAEADVTNERLHAAKECKARSVLSKFKDMEQKVANGEEIDDPLLAHKRPLKRFTPPRKLGEESGSEYSDSEYSDSEYTGSYSSYTSEDEEEEDEYLRNIREAARAKQLRAKFEEWEAQVGEDGGYTNLVDENGLPLETAGKLRNRFERLAMEEAEESQSKPKFQVRRFK